jgi:SatD family (SatD)
VSPKGSVFTLIGDVVESRQTTDRRLLQRRLGGVMEEMNHELEPQVPFEPTLGDEFQACFDDIAAAVRASLMVRLGLLRTAGVDSRYGLGVGLVEVLAERPRLQDGPGWWAARNAMESTRRLAEAPHTSFVRTSFSAVRSSSRRWEEEEAALNAFLLCRDALVDRMKQPSRNRLYGLMRQWPQARIAVEEGTTQGAISQSLARSGAFAILAAQERLEGRSW